MANFFTLAEAAAKMRAFSQNLEASSP